VIDLGIYLVLWASVLFAHVVRVLMGLWGIEPVLITGVRWAETGVFMASFAGFFVRILLRIYLRLSQNPRVEPVL
jgi:hypothetical protein